MPHNEQDIADFTDPSWMVAAIRMVVKTAGEPTFAEVISIHNFSAGVAFGVFERNLCMWPTVSQVAVDVLAGLLRDGEIHILPCRSESVHASFA